MATRSTIALEFADGTVQQVYCHWDGYLEHNGKILKEHYSDPFKLRDLIDLGSISSLQAEIGEKHAFSHFDTDMTQEQYYTKFGKFTTFYARDRGEDLKIEKFKDIQDYYTNVYGEEYDYILSMNWEGKAQWYVRYHATEGNWVPIEFELEKYAIEEEEIE
jgi:hypothetical protein